MGHSRGRAPQGRLVLAVLLCSLSAGTASAATSPVSRELHCQGLLYDAASKYERCCLSVFGKLYAGRIPAPTSDTRPIDAMLWSCSEKYQQTWAKLRASPSLADTGCDRPRFEADGTTVLDHLTGLRWEKKTGDGTAHDKDAIYWGLFEGVGSAFTDFLSTVNQSCFAGYCDWRLPSIAELYTILVEGFPCQIHPCINPKFGPTALGLTLTSTQVGSPVAHSPDFASYLALHFDDGSLQAAAPAHTRAVRGGLR